MRDMIQRLRDARVPRPDWVRLLETVGQKTTRPAVKSQSPQRRFGTCADRSGSADDATRPTE